MRLSYGIFVSVTFLTTSCQVKPYAPPPQRAFLESVTVEIKDFHGRPDATAVVKGRLSTSVAQLVDPEQSREDGVLLIEVLEQTPRGADLLPDLKAGSSFETRIPIELLGLPPGPYRLVANELETQFVVPNPQAELYAEPVAHQHAVTLVDEFIPIEDSSFVEPEATTTPPDA